MFDRLVWAVFSYGVEIWGWAEREGVERYLRWLLGIDRRTPSYMVREEMLKD